MSTPRYRDTSVERRTRAAACVERHLDELAAVTSGRSSIIQTP